MPKTSRLKCLLSKFRDRRADRKQFPITWLTYKQRVRDDVETFYKTKNGPEFFDDKYVEALGKTVEQLETRELKLFAYQLGIAISMILTLLSGDGSITIFGVSLKNATGLKELLRHSGGSAAQA